MNYLRLYHESGMSKHGFCMQHGICNATLLRSWLKKYESAVKSLSLQSGHSNDSDMENCDRDDYKREIAELKRRNRELEKALEFSRLETLARDMMIDRAEEYFDIAIRKKPGAK